MRNIKTDNKNNGFKTLKEIIYNDVDNSSKSEKGRKKLIEILRNVGKGSEESLEEFMPPEPEIPNHTYNNIGINWDEDWDSEDDLQINNPITYDELNMIDWPLHVFDSYSKSVANGARDYDIFTWHKVTRKAIKGYLKIEGELDYYDEDVYLALMKLSSEQQFASKALRLSSWNAILEELKWSRGGKNYWKLEKALTRLTSITLETNIFYMSNLSTYEFRRFHILDRLSLSMESSPRYVEVDWGNTIANNIIGKLNKKKNIRPLNFDIYLQLKSPEAKKLFRVIDKRLFLRDRAELPFNYIAHSVLGISPQRRHEYIKRNICKFMDELVDLGVISAYGIKANEKKDKLMIRFAKLKSV